MAEEFMQFKLDIVSAEKELFSGYVRTMHITGVEGQLGIRHGHTPLLTMIKPGRVAFTTLEGKDEVMYLSGGILEIQPTRVTVLADTAIRAEEIDTVKAEEAVKAARERIESKADDVDYASAIIELSKALAQLKVVELTKGRR
jgi:F-type H+-transporting ATPase subunit epsilon